MVGSRYMYIMMKSEIITEQWVTENSSWLYFLVYFPVFIFGHRVSTRPSLV